MALSRETLEQIASATAFRHEVLETVAYLLAILDAINQDEFLAPRLVLKGGTALNLFYFNLPRLSVDIDLNYIGSSDRRVMESERAEIESNLFGILRRLKLDPALSKSEDHACRCYVASYQSHFSGRGSVKVDINYLHRVTLWPVERMPSISLGHLQVVDVPVLCKYELAAGKIVALMMRQAGRDLFDVARLSNIIDSTDPDLRLAYVIYAAKQPKNWTDVSLDSLRYDGADLAKKLFPVLQADAVSAINMPQQYIDGLLQDCAKFLSPLFPLTGSEVEFVDRLRAGVIDASLITNDPVKISLIKQDPALLWRASRGQKSIVDRRRSSVVALDPEVQKFLSKRNQSKSQTTESSDTGKQVRDDLEKRCLAEHKKVADSLRVWAAQITEADNLAPGMCRLDDQDQFNFTFYMSAYTCTVQFLDFGPEPLGSQPGFRLIFNKGKYLDLKLDTAGSAMSWSSSSPELVFSDAKELASAILDWANDQNFIGQLSALN